MYNVLNKLPEHTLLLLVLKMVESLQCIFKERNVSPTALRWFASDTVHFCIYLYIICGEASGDLYREEQSL